MDSQTAINSDQLYHLGCYKGEVGKYVLLPGNPGRVPLIAALLDDAQEISHNREYLTYTGILLGEKVSVTSTGMGCPSTAIAIEELKIAGADTFVRVGTSGPMQQHIKHGDLIIAWGAIRDEFTSKQYVPPEYPAVADFEVTSALRQAARNRNVRHHVGLTQSKDSFYGQHEPKRMPVKTQLLERWQAWITGGTLCSEMEASTIFVLSRILKCRSGAIMTAGIDLTNLLVTAVDGLKLLIEYDKKRGFN
tara:strand:- start:750 stop:1496 length:747 start_codon:yes stop_codon:yes gene_type:complete